MSETEPKTDTAAKPAEKPAEKKGMSTTAKVLLGLLGLGVVGSLLPENRKARMEERVSEMEARAKLQQERSELQQERAKLQQERSEVAQAAAPAAPTDSVAVVSALDLFSDYNKNEVGADLKYKGKILEVSGKFARSSVVSGFLWEDGSLTVTVVGSKGNVVLKDAEVTCYFDLSDANKQAIAALSVGSNVTMRGKGRGMMMGIPPHPSMEECVVVQR